MNLKLSIIGSVLKVDFTKEIEGMKNDMSFNNVWGSIAIIYPLLRMFCGGIVSAFPGTSTVESDFSMIGFEKDSY